MDPPKAHVTSLEHKPVRWAGPNSVWPVHPFSSFSSDFRVETSSEGRTTAQSLSVGARLPVDCECEGAPPPQIRTTPPMRAPAMLRWAAAALAALLAASPAAAFYLPGVAPNDFHKVQFPSLSPHLPRSVMVLSPPFPRWISAARSIVWSSSSWMRAVVFGISGGPAALARSLTRTRGWQWHTLFTHLT